ncbi:Probable transcriptional regulator ycf27 (OmpR-like protein), partial [Durusdinium trenchii]
KLEEGRVEVLLDNCDVRMLIEEVREEMKVLLKKGQDIEFNEAGAPQMLETDRRLLKNVLINLTSNAIKYSPEDKTVKVNLSYQRDSLNVAICDEGIGIPEEDQKHLFTRFFRAGNAVNLNGTGLGLNIVKKYLELLNGTMKKIVLIEDNPDVRENTAEILELADFEVLTAANGKDGVEIASKEDPDLVICDIMMPELDGYGVLHILSRKESTRNIPFIFMTAKAEKSEIRKGMNLGADDYITKPFDDTELLDAVEARLKKADLIKQEYAKNLEGFDSFVDDAENIHNLKDLTKERKVRSYKKKKDIFLE